MTNNRIAIFVDAENVGGWIKQGGVDVLVNELKNLGQIIIRRAYGVWSRPQLAMHQATLNKQGFELIHCYHPALGKNSADIHMTVDVMECAWQFGNINYFVLVTGDSDFSPVFRRLRAIGKEVIGVGQNSTLSQCIEGTCSRYIYTDEFVESSQKLPKNALEVQNQSQADTPAKIQKAPTQKAVAQVTLARAMELTKTVLKAEKKPINISQLRNKLVASDKKFDHKLLGFGQFSAYLSAIDGIKLEKKGSAQFASLIEKSGKSNSVKTGENNESAIKYDDLLHKQGIYPISAEKLKLIYKLSCSLNDVFSDISIDEFLTVSAVQKLKIDKVDVKNAVNIFYRSKLTDNENGVVRLRKMPMQEFLLAIDNMLISTLFEISKSNSIELKAKEIKKLTVSSISKDDIKKMIKVA